MKISPDVMFCIEMYVVQSLHDYIEIFERSSIAGGLVENTTTIFKFLLIVCANLA